MSELYSLYKLHKIDSALHSLRQEAAGLDTGQEEAGALKALTAEQDGVVGRAKALHAEQKNLELEQKALEEKIAGFNKKLYDGSIVSPKEIENIEKEIAMLKGVSDKNDERLLELMEELPPAVSEADAAKARADELKAKIQVKRDAAVKRHAEIKKEFDDLRKQRPEIAAEVDKDLLERYEQVRKRTGDTGMADVSDDQRCSVCGIHIPEKQMAMLNEDRLSLCEGCHRILFKVVPAV